MKKIVILLLIFIASITTFTVLNKNSNKVFAMEDNLKFETNYKKQDMLRIEIKYNSPKDGYEYDEFSNYYENLDTVTVKIFKKYFNTDYVQLKKAYLNGDELTVAETGTEITIVIDEFLEAQLNLIKLEFDVASFKLTCDSFAAGLGSSDTIDGQLMNFYKKVGEQNIPIEKTNGEYYITYDEIHTLVIEPHKKITYNNGSMSFSLQKVYLSFPDESFLLNSYTIDIVDSFLDIHGMFNEIHFYCVYGKDSNVKLTFDNESLAVPYQISIIDGSTAKPADINQFFEEGTKLEITFEIAPYTQLTTYGDGSGNFRIDDLSKSDEIISKGNGKYTIAFTIIRDKHFKVYLEYKIFEVDKEGSDAGTEFSSDTFKYGQPIRVYSYTSGINKIKSWKINGIEVPKINQTANGMTRIDENTVEIDTAVWFSKYGNKFVSDVETGVKQNVILLITLPISATLLLAVILLLIVLKHSSTKKKIKKVLESEKSESYKYNQGSMISDLKDDKFMTVSKNEIKERMKKKE